MLRVSSKVLTNLSRNLPTISAINRLNIDREMHSLVQNKAFIDGAWINSADSKNFNVINPANQEVLAAVPDMGAVDINKAIDAAHTAFYSKEWQDTTAKDRSGMLKV